MLSNLFALLPADTSQEHFHDLLNEPGLRIERIVSNGQSSPPGFWYDQPWDEWVIVLQGEAWIQIKEQPDLLKLSPGEHCWLPTGCQHRVERTCETGQTIWLAVHRLQEGKVPSANPV